MAEQAVSRIRSNLLSGNPDLESWALQQLQTDFDRFARDGLSPNLEQHLIDAYGLDVSTTYAGLPIKNPWGKASGQLSMTAQQVAEDAAAGLGFCVLKTLIAQDAAGTQSMSAWAIPESRMVLERIRAAGGEEGWTVSWKGRGWSRSFDDYLTLVREARAIGAAAGMLVVPSCKFHLPTPAEPTWKTGEYEFTCQQLQAAFATSPGDDAPMPLEKDFSPTLAGSDLAREKSQILEWLGTIPRLVRSALGVDRVRVGLKLFNALFDDEFQLKMLEAVTTAADIDRPDFIVYANRLMDPLREFEGHRGIAFGGPDLSARNLRILREFQRSPRDATGGDGAEPGRPIESVGISATGNIGSGRVAVEYLLRGCSSFQLHTYFQLPASEFPMRHGSKIAKALHVLYFDPRDGFVAWLLHVARRLGLPRGSMVRLQELVGAGRTMDDV